MVDGPGGDVGLDVLLARPAAPRRHLLVVVPRPQAVANVDDDVLWSVVTSAMRQEMPRARFTMHELRFDPRADPPRLGPDRWPWLVRTCALYPEALCAALVGGVG